eukprot:scaffold42561_cov183-Amphora_coffeaeformis.AAC.2
MSHALPDKRQKYPKSTPRLKIHPVAQRAALGSLANKAMPPDKDMTPPPIVFLERFATSDEIDEVPADRKCFLLSSSGSTALALRAKEGLTSV